MKYSLRKGAKPSPIAVVRQQLRDVRLKFIIPAVGGGMVSVWIMLIVASITLSQNPTIFPSNLEAFQRFANTVSRPVTDPNFLGDGIPADEKNKSPKSIDYYVNDRLADNGATQSSPNWTIPSTQPRTIDETVSIEPGVGNGDTTSPTDILPVGQSADPVLPIIATPDCGRDVTQSPAASDVVDTVTGLTGKSVETVQTILPTF